MAAAKANSGEEEVETGAATLEVTAGAPAPGLLRVIVGVMAALLPAAGLLGRPNPKATGAGSLLCCGTGLGLPFSASSAAAAVAWTAAVLLAARNASPQPEEGGAAAGLAIAGEVAGEGANEVLPKVTRGRSLLAPGLAGSAGGRPGGGGGGGVRDRHKAVRRGSQW